MGSLRLCSPYRSAAAMSESGEASSASRSPSPPAPRAFCGPSPLPGSTVRPQDDDDRHRDHSSRRLSGRHGCVRLRNSADARGSRGTSPAPPPWSVVLDALADLRGEVEALKADRRQLPPPTGSAQVTVEDSTLGGWGLSPPCSATFSGFSARMSEDEAVSMPAAPADSTLIQGTKAFGPSDTVVADIDNRVAEMVNFLFDNGMREEDYKAMCEDDVVKRPNNCHALAPVECNPQVLEALKLDARKTDFRLEVNKDILRASTIITKSLVALDDLAEQEGNPKLAHEVSMLNGALALLGNANHRHNLARRFVMKREINYKYAHLCSDKVPITRFLFSDDVSQSARQIEEAEKLRSKFSQKKPAFTSKFAGKRPGGYWNKPASRGYYARFQPYGQQRYGSRAAPRLPSTRQDVEPKNSKGRGGRSRQPQ